MKYEDLVSVVIETFPEAVPFDWFEFDGSEVLEMQGLNPASCPEAFAQLPPEIKWEYEEGNDDDIVENTTFHL